jgi:L-ascorbate metabolism protein UlaG (beta-lactamase superfamily)
MKITKLAHSCLLVEMPEPVNRTVLFDPGIMSAELIKAADLVYLDDIVITHEHQDHFDTSVVTELAAKFPEVRILAPQPVAGQLQQNGISASTTPAEGMKLFAAPHEELQPLGKTPEAIGVHYLDRLTHPGDSHHFDETKPVLALPVTAPWGTTVRAVELALRLKPQYVIPIHDWLWRDEWREQMYDGLAARFAAEDIEFIRPVDGQPFVLDIAVKG